MSSIFREFNLEFLAGTPRRNLHHEGGELCSGFNYMAAIYVKDPAILKDGLVDVEAIKEKLYTARFYQGHNRPFTMTATQCGRFSNGFMFNIAID